MCVCVCVCVCVLPLLSYIVVLWRTRCSRHTGSTPDGVFATPPGDDGVLDL